MDRSLGLGDTLAEIAVLPCKVFGNWGNLCFFLCTDEEVLEVSCTSSWNSKLNTCTCVYFGVCPSVSDSSRGLSAVCKMEVIGANDKVTTVPESESGPQIHIPVHVDGKM